MLTWNTSDPCQLAILDDGRPESPRAHHALLDYLRLGPGRSLPDLLHRYHDLESAPTHSHGTLRDWSSQYAWPARAASFDDLEDQHLQAEYRAHRDAILQHGLALDHERVEHLIAMYDRLAALALTDEALWIKDVKALHLEHDQVERVELRRFNGDLIRHMRGLLDDIATETGGRVNHPQPFLQMEEPALDSEDFSLDVLPPDERAEFIRLQNKIFSPS